MVRIDVGGMDQLMQMDFTVLDEYNREDMLLEKLQIQGLSADPFDFNAQSQDF